MLTTSRGAIVSLLVISVIVGISFSPLALSSSSSLIFNNKQFTDWIKQCTNSAVGKKNPANQEIFTVSNAVTYCTHLLQTNISQKTGNQTSSSGTVLPSQQYQYQNPYPAASQNPYPAASQNPYPAASQNPYPAASQNPYPAASQNP